MVILYGRTVAVPKTQETSMSEFAGCPKPIFNAEEHGKPDRFQLMRSLIAGDEKHENIIESLPTAKTHLSRGHRGNDS